jgi:beta-alanine--pyruvate transaminase
VLVRCFEAGLLTRVTADTIACSPPLMVSASQIEEIFGTLGKVLRHLA